MEIDNNQEPSWNTLKKANLLIKEKCKWLNPSNNQVIIIIELKGKIIPNKPSKPIPIIKVDKR